MFFQIVNNGITLHIKKEMNGLINHVSLPMHDILGGPGKRLCITGTGYGRIFQQGEAVNTQIHETELKTVSQGDAVPISIWFFPFMGKGWMGINFVKDGKDQCVAVPVNIVAEGVEI